MICFSHLHQSRRLPGHHRLHLISPVVSRWSPCCFSVLYNLFSPLVLPPCTWRSLNKHTRSVLYEVSWAAHKAPQTGGLKQRDIFISALETRTLKAGCRQGCAALKYLEDGPSLSPPAFGGGRQALVGIHPMACRHIAPIHASNFSLSENTLSSSTRDKMRSLHLDCMQSYRHLVLFHCPQVPQHLNSCRHLGAFPWLVSSVGKVIT